MGVSLPESYYRDEIIVAEKSLSKKNEFLCKYGNIKVNSSVAWLPASVVRKASELTFSIEDFRETYCVGGIDLSQTTDKLLRDYRAEQKTVHVFKVFYAGKQNQRTARGGGCAL